MIPYPYAAALATGGLSVIGLFYLGRKLIKCPHVVAGLVGKAKARVLGCPVRVVIEEDELGDDDEEYDEGDDDEEYYEALSDEPEPVAGTVRTGVLDLSRGDDAGKPILNKFQIRPTKSKQSLVSCESCFCCRARKVISACLPRDVVKKPTRPIYSESVSEDSLGGVHHRL